MPRLCNITQYWVSESRRRRRGSSSSSHLGRGRGITRCDATRGAGAPVRRGLLSHPSPCAPAPLPLRHALTVETGRSGRAKGRLVAGSGTSYSPPWPRSTTLPLSKSTANYMLKLFN